MEIVVAMSSRRGSSNIHHSRLGASVLLQIQANAKTEKTVRREVSEHGLVYTISSNETVGMISFELTS